MDRVISPWVYGGYESDWRVRWSTRLLTFFWLKLPHTDPRDLYILNSAHETDENNEHTQSSIFFWRYSDIFLHSRYIGCHLLVLDHHWSHQNPLQCWHLQKKKRNKVSCLCFSIYYRIAFFPIEFQMSMESEKYIEDVWKEFQFQCQL